MKPHTSLRLSRTLDSPIGPLTIEANDRGAVTGLSMSGWYRPAGQNAISSTEASALFDDIEQQLRTYFTGDRTKFEIDVEPAGNQFQQSVWRLLQEIPYGETWSYGMLARRLGDISLARAVGAACGANPIAVIIPCHRVIGADGNLTGFGGGLANKEYLLHLENPERFPLRPMLFN